MKLKNILFLISLLIAASGSAWGQLSLERQLLSSTGAYQSSGPLDLSASMGEVAVNYVLSGTLSLSEGFQQAGPASNTGLTAELPSLAYEIYPNPTSGLLQVVLQSEQQIFIRLVLFDVKGRATGIQSPVFLLQGRQARQLNLEGLSAGTYLLQLMREGKSLGAFLVQKRL
jgi:hypothetical protein